MRNIAAATSTFVLQVEHYHQFSVAPDCPRRFADLLITGRSVPACQLATQSDSRDRAGKPASHATGVILPPPRVTHRDESLLSD
jgi:hypothetical protein